MAHLPSQCSSSSGPCMPGFCEGNIVADITACPEYSLTNPSAPADSKIKPGSSNDRVDIFVVRGCMSRPHWQLPAILNITEARTEYLYRVDITRSRSPAKPSLSNFAVSRGMTGSEGTIGR